MWGWAGLRIAGLCIAVWLAGSAAAGAQIAGQAAPARGARSPAAKPRPACQLDVIGAGVVSAVHDGRSFALDDGREVRLAAIETPPAPDPGESGPDADAATAATAALAEIVLGKRVELHQRISAADRYGRILAYVTVTPSAGPSGSPSSARQDTASQESASQESVAHLLVERGWARVAADVDEPACGAELIARERMARAQSLGLWAEPDYAILGAENGANLLERQGHFAVVEGKVLSVRESGGTIYMNFGRRWSEGLTVTISKRRERTFAAAGLQPDRLVNLRLRVRGFIEERSGPRMEATRPEQIEIAGGK